MRILIIGGTRFIGPGVVRCLRDAGHDVCLFHRGQTKAPLPAGVQRILGNRRFLSEFAEAFKRFSPDIVLDMFALTERDARSVMGTFKGIARRVVAVSSTDVYRAYGRLTRAEPGPPDPVPLSEEAPLREKLYPYRGQIDALADYDKILVERAVMGGPDLPGTILRLPMVYGPRDNQHRLFDYLKRMDDQRPAILMAEGLAAWRWSRGYVDNVAAAIALAVAEERAAGRIYNVAEPEALTMADWIRAVGQTAGWRGTVVVLPKDRLPSHLTWDIDTNQEIVTDTSRIRNELGYTEAVTLERGLRETIAWERDHPPERIDPSQFDYAQEDKILHEWRRRSEGPNGARK